VCEDCSYLKEIPGLGSVAAWTYASSTIWRKYKYPAIFGTYLLVTGSLIVHFTRHPSSRSMRNGQIETILKTTTLATAITCIGASGKLNTKAS
jgi:hypothetical protein